MGSSVLDRAFEMIAANTSPARFTDPTMKEYALCKQEHPEKLLLICFSRIKARTI
jgi:hypothetical protein